MIDRGRVLRLAMGATSSITDDELSELCRVYLAWLDAPAARVNQFGELEADAITMNRLKRKQVRLVEVK